MIAAPTRASRTIFHRGAFSVLGLLVLFSCLLAGVVCEGRRIRGGSSGFWSLDVSFGGVLLTCGFIGGSEYESRIHRRPEGRGKVGGRNAKVVPSPKTTGSGKAEAQAEGYLPQITRQKRARLEWLRLPRPCRFVVERVTALASQFGIREALAEYLAHAKLEPLRISQVFAVVVPERLLIKVTEKMIRFYTHIRARDATFQQRPKVLKAVGMYATIYVLNSMIYNFVRVVASESVIGHECIGVECSASGDVLAYFVLQDSLAATRNDFCANLPATLQDAEDSRFVLAASSGDSTLAFAHVHVASLATYERFVNFYFALRATAEPLAVELILHGCADAVQHEPRSFLSDFHVLGDLATTDAVLAVSQHPKRHHPLVESDGRILEYRADLERELFLADVAEPAAIALDERVFFSATARTRDFAVTPAQIDGIFKSTFWVAEVDNRFLQTLWGFHA